MTVPDAAIAVVPDLDGDWTLVNGEIRLRVSLHVDAALDAYILFAHAVKQEEYFDRVAGKKLPDDD